MAKNDERPIILRVKRKPCQSRFDALWLQINDKPLNRALLELEKLSVSAAASSPNIGVKRTASQSQLDALFAGLEVNERPLKRAFLDFGKLSISEFSASIVEEFKTRKVLLCHVKTVINSEVSYDALQSVVVTSADASKFEIKSKEIRRIFKAKRNKYDQLLPKAKQSKEFVSKNAQFMQIWRSRESKEKATQDESLHDKCQFYDVVRIDFEETNQEMLNNHKRCSASDDHELMSRYLPLLQKILPSAAIEIESDYVDSHAPSDGFLYDIYVVNDENNIAELDVAQTLPMVQVDAEDDYNDGPHGSEYESEDSNAENNLRNEYPDEKPSEEINEYDKSSETRSKIDWTKTDWSCFDDKYSGAEGDDDDDDDDDDDEEEDWE